MVWLCLPLHGGILLVSLFISLAAKSTKNKTTKIYLVCRLHQSPGDTKAGSQDRNLNSATEAGKEAQLIGLFPRIFSAYYHKQHRKPSQAEHFLMGIGTIISTIIKKCTTDLTTSKLKKAFPQLRLVYPENSIFYPTDKELTTILVGLILYKSSEFFCSPYWYLCSSPDVSRKHCFIGVINYSWL